MTAARVLVVNASGEVSGAEHVLLRLIDAARDRGVSVTVASPPGPLVNRLRDGVAHIAIPAFGLGGARGIRRLTAAAAWAARTPKTVLTLRKQLRDEGGRSTHVLVNSLLALPAVRAARPAGRPAWLVHDTVHSTLQRIIVEVGTRRRRPTWHVVAVSDATAAPLRVLGLDVVVRRNGVPWPVEAADVQQRQPPVVGMAALLTAWKGQQVLLEALARLPGVHAELAGGSFALDQHYVDELHERAARPDLAGRVRFLGHVDPLPTMRTWDVLVSASTSPEAGPLGILEAMSIGLPVVATDHGGSAEYLAHGGGVLVPPDDPAALAAALRSLLDDPDRRRALAESGRRAVADRFDLAATFPALCDAVLGSGE